MFLQNIAIATASFHWRISFENGGGFVNRSYRTYRVLPLMAMLFAVALLLSGCAAAVVGGAAGAGAVMFKEGELKSTERGNVDQVYNAAINAVDKLKLDTVTKNADSLNAKILAKESNGDNVDIKMEQKPNNLTEVKIRVGAVGNQERARLILDEIRRELGEA